MYSPPVLSKLAAKFKDEIQKNSEAKKQGDKDLIITAEHERYTTKIFLKKWLVDAPPMPLDVKITDQDLIVEKNYRVKLRIYRPDSLLNNRPSPAILYHPAGGLVNDMQKEQDLPCALMSKASNSLVISIQPPLAPEIKHSKIVAIVDSVTEYIFKNINKFGIDHDAIGISGYSMGGNLALLTTLHALQKSLPIKLLAIISGQVDISLQARDNREFNEGADLDFLAPREMQVKYTNFVLPIDANPSVPEFSPLYADLQRLPPTVLIGGSCDALMPDMRAMKEACSKQNVKVNLIEVPGAIHNAFFMWHKLGGEGAHMATLLGEALFSLISER